MSGCRPAGTARSTSARPGCRPAPAPGRWRTGILGTSPSAARVWGTGCGCGNPGRRAGVRPCRPLRSAACRWRRGSDWPFGRKPRRGWTGWRPCGRSASGRARCVRPAGIRRPWSSALPCRSGRARPCASLWTRASRGPSRDRRRGTCPWPRRMRPWSCGGSRQR